MAAEEDDEPIAIIDVDVESVPQGVYVPPTPSTPSQGGSTPIPTGFPQEWESALDELIGMGFDINRAKAELRAANGIKEAAVEALLQG